MQPQKRPARTSKGNQRSQKRRRLSRYCMLLMLYTNASDRVGKNGSPLDKVNTSDVRQSKIIK